MRVKYEERSAVCFLTIKYEGKLHSVSIRARLHFNHRQRRGTFGKDYSDSSGVLRFLDRA